MMIHPKTAQDSGGDLLLQNGVTHKTEHRGRCELAVWEALVLFQLEEASDRDRSHKVA